jgi:hypothetical protein
VVEPVASLQHAAGPAVTETSRPAPFGAGRLVAVACCYRRTRNVVDALVPPPVADAVQVPTRRTLGKEAWNRPRWSPTVLEYRT